MKITYMTLKNSATLTLMLATAAWTSACGGSKLEIADASKNTTQTPSVIQSGDSVSEENNTADFGQIIFPPKLLNAGNAKYASIAAGVMHTCAISENGLISCWGWNNSGQLGNGTMTNSKRPIIITRPSTMSKAVQLALGPTHTCALDDLGKVWCWGSNNSGEIGAKILSSGGIDKSVNPILIAGLPKVNRISAGSEQTCALASGKIYCWGRLHGFQIFGQTAFSTTPHEITILTQATQISLGLKHACAIQSGAVYCWGENSNKQLGSDDNTYEFQPTLVSGSNSVVSISSGGYQTCAVTSYKAAYCWGNNQQLQLGITSATNCSNGNCLVNAIPGLTINKLSMGIASTCAIFSNGEAKCWGANNTYQLGNSSAPSNGTAIPQIISGVEGSTMIANGGYHACAIKNGLAICWGNNAYGQLGINSDAQAALPTTLSPLYF